MAISKTNSILLKTQIQIITKLTEILCPKTYPFTKCNEYSYTTVSGKRNDKETLNRCKSALQRHTKQGFKGFNTLTKQEHLCTPVFHCKRLDLFK